MNKTLRRLLFVLAGLGGLYVLVWLGAHAFTANSQWARAIAWLQSDFDDHKRFPRRVIENAAPAFHFQQPSEETKQQLTPAFETITYRKNEEQVTKNLDDFLEETNTVAFLVIKDDTLLYENYFNGYDRTSTVTSFSVAKSFVSALTGIAIAEGFIDSVEEPITTYVPELLDKDPHYQEITLRHLLTMSSGIRYDEFGMPWSDDAATYYSPDLRATAMSSSIDGEPGRTFHYNNFHPLLLGLVLERTTNRHVADYLAETLWKPLGMESPGSWSLDSEQSGFEKMESGINGRAIDFAKFGRLFLNRGRWNGEQLIPPEWVDASTRRDTVTDPAPQYQYFWWVDTNANNAPPYYASGKHGQYIYIVPEQNLLFARFGETDPYGRWTELFLKLAENIATLS